MDHGKPNVVFASSSTRNGGGGGIGSVSRVGTFSQMVRLIIRLRLKQLAN